LGFLRNTDLGVAIKRRYFDVAAQCGSGEADRHFTVQFVMVTLKDRMRAYLDDDVEVARWSAIGTCFAFAG
jgi:hypothetical protein